MKPVLLFLGLLFFGTFGFSGTTQGLSERKQEPEALAGRGENSKTAEGFRSLSPQDELERLRAHNRNYGKWVRELQRENRQLRRFAQPNYHVQNAMRLAATIWPVSYWQLKSVAKCESGLWPFARNGRYRGLFQTGPMFERGPFGSFSVWDPYANVFTAALTASRQGWRQWSCKP